MYKVTGKQQFGGVFGLVKFHKGIGYVATKEAAETLKGMGYTVEGEPEPKAPVDDPPADPLDGMTVKELTAYAAEKGIDLKDAGTKKADILAAIKAAEAGNAEGDQNPAT